MNRESLNKLSLSAEAEPKDIIHLAAWLLSAAIVIGALYIGQGVLIPLAIAFLISFALNPLVTWLNRKGLPRVLSVIIVMLTLAAFVVGLGALMTTQIRSLSEQLPVYESTIRNKISAVGEQIRKPGALDGAIKTVDTVKAEVTANVAPETDAPNAQRVQIVEPPDGPIKTAASWLGPALAPLATAGIVVVFVFLALLDRGDLRDRLIRLLGGNLHRSTDAMEDAGKRISKYLLMQLVVNVSYGIPMGLGLWLIGVPGWLLWGALATVMRFIPYVGPMLSAIFPITLAFAVDPGWEMVMWTVGLVVLLEVVSNNVVEPLLYGTSTGLSAMSLIAAATFWTALWGPVGLILSTPLTVCLLVVGRNHPQLQFLDTLLGSTPVLDVPTRIYQRLIADDPEEAIEIVEDAIGEAPLIDFYHDHGIEMLRRISDDYRNNARAEHRLRLANGMDTLLEELRDAYPAPLDSSQAARIACIGGKWEIDSVACEMVAHALALEGIPATTRREGIVTSRYIDKLDLNDIDIVCLSYFSREPEAAVKAFCRRLNQRWPGKKIVLALWNANEALLETDAVEALGADEVVNSIHECVRRLQRMAMPQTTIELQTAQAPDNDQERVDALLATQVLDGHARDDLDALAKRASDVFDVKFAVISAIDARQEFIIGQSLELPGRQTRDGTAMITMPRKEAICDHVVSDGEMLVVEDTQRDPRFADHPAVQLWSTRFYAGAPLVTAEGHVLGALCLLDTEPREFTEEEMNLLDTMAADAVSLITGDEVVTPEPREEQNSASTLVGQKVPE